jgi:hypothetical protein
MSLRQPKRAVSGRRSVNAIIMQTYFEQPIAAKQDEAERKMANREKL